MSANEPRTTVDLGYYFAPRLSNTSPGHPRLTITLHDTPTLRHYDPERVRLPLIVDGAHGDVDQAMFQRRWYGGNRLRLCAGRIRLTDRRWASRHAFTYGGEATVYQQTDCTRLVIDSPAPILDLTTGDMTSLPALLATWTEALIAQRRAAWHRDHPCDSFEGCLACADPADLYPACIAALDEKFKDLPYTGEEMTLFVRFLKAERRRLARTHGSQLPDLGSLL